MRPSWDEFFMEMAFLACKRSTCASRKVGAVMVKDRHVIATGYNGSPPGMAHCDDIGCLIQDDRCVRTIHAEQNAILQAAVHGISTQGAAIYTTHRPCDVCSKLLVGAGIAKIYYVNGTPDGWGKEVLDAAGIEMIQLKQLDLA
jgi:dCMP deaminase